MDNMRIPAHFDGNQIILDEPVELDQDAKLLITVLPKELTDDHEAWIRLSQQGLANAYSDDEVEYTLDSIKEFNPDYEGR
ncbi:MAG: hypothetical protein H0X37_23635 [Herpetosiphonaceae bacterium]|nr:hypothetical protein [Herpetosiphonaceae bacterium]